MPRSSSKSSSSRSYSSTPAPAVKRTPPPPAPSAQRVPPPAANSQIHPPAPAYPQQQGGGGIMSGIVQGMSLGAGSAIGRRAVDSVFGAFSGSGQPSSEPVARTPQTAAPAGPCDFDQTAFVKCMQENKGDAVACETYFTSLQRCQMSNN